MNTKLNLTPQVIDVLANLQTDNESYTGSIESAIDWILEYSEFCQEDNAKDLLKNIQQLRFVSKELLKLKS